MTFRDYYIKIGLRAFLASCRADYDEIQRLRGLLSESDMLREKERQGFLDRQLATMNFKPIHLQPPPPIPLPSPKPAMNMNSLMDAAAAEIEKAKPQTREQRVSELEEKLRAIAPNGIPSNGNGVSV